MAVQPLNAPQPPSPPPQGPQGGRTPQPPIQEVQQPRERDQITVSKQASDQAKVAAPRLAEVRLAEALLAEQVQQGVALQARKDENKQADTVPNRVDFTA